MNFEVVDKTDEVSSKHCFEVVDAKHLGCAQNTVLRLQMNFEVVDKTDEVSSKHCFEVVDAKHCFEVVDRLF
ncbi:chlorohydrolase [Streptococcus pneumoniae]|uniref:hypothetical protein n=1 Tax=Streptococcus pneumoniae TaxID=1313 RepID=UPI000B63142B|nr:hypothetical protein [Streptococcus pneumoniae]SNJ69718.1 chlorohydrolase [Streptococcus pneumoniae]